MYRQYLSRKNSPSRSSTARSKDIAPRRSYGSLSSVLQRAQKDPKGISDDEWKQLDSAIGSRVTGEVLGGDAPGTILEKGISARLWGDSVQEGEPIQAKGIAENEMREAQNPNNTGLPDKLKAGVERLSGLSMDDVKVYYNSSKPAELQALAYAQGNRIYVGPGQKKHLAHEAWHVVQQKQGRVSKGNTIPRTNSICYDRALEEEATRKGREASQCIAWVDQPRVKHGIDRGSRGGCEQRVDSVGIHEVIQAWPPSIKDLGKKEHDSLDDFIKDFDKIDPLRELKEMRGYRSKWDEGVFNRFAPLSHELVKKGLILEYEMLDLGKKDNLIIDYEEKSKQILSEEFYNSGRLKRKDRTDLRNIASSVLEKHIETKSKEVGTSDWFEKRKLSDELDQKFEEDCKKAGKEWRESLDYYKKQFGR
jgi:hypothetical protein